MGIYSLKFESAAELDSVQTPDDIGVDLDQVEKDIVGDEGIEAHADEVEAAEEGLIGDPVEEAAFIMYESEYNYNQIMQAIGVAELREASYGREMIYEAADIKGFFKKVKELLEKMFAGITKAVKTVLAKLDVAVKMDKKYVNDNKKFITEGASKDWKASGYEFPEIKIDFGTGGADKASSAREDLRTLKSNPSTSQLEGIKKVITAEAIENRKKGVAKALTNGATESTEVNQIAKDVTEKVFGEKVENLNGKWTAARVIDILSNDRETKAIRELYNAVKGSYKKSLKEVSDMEREITSADYAVHTSLAMSVCERATTVIKFEKNVTNVTYGVFMKAARAKRAQARKLAHAFVKAAKKKEDTSAASSAKNESASFFGAINLV